MTFQRPTWGALTALGALSGCVTARETEVVSVSADLLAEQTSMGPMTYFLARVQITPEGMKGLGRHQIQPGMPAEVIIRTGERTVLTYLLHPLTRRVAASMKEQ
jgi:protease secretion system membrane fusion protein